MVSSPRMSRYANHSSPEALHRWNPHLTKTYLTDIEHLEMLLRNCIHDALTRRYNEQWFDDAQAVCLNVFFTRLFYCYFAEDTGLFRDGSSPGYCLAFA